MTCVLFIVASFLAGLAIGAWRMKRSYDRYWKALHDTARSLNEKDVQF